MKYLNVFQLGEEFDGHKLPMDILTDLPVQGLLSWHFRMSEENIHETVKTLSKMKNLKDFKIYPNNQTNFKLTPKDFELFKHLPVTSVDLDALDLTKDNLSEFRQIMLEMKIEDIDWEINYDDFEITITDFGPRGIYKTI